MKVVPLTCPNCGAALTPPDRGTTVRCEFCDRVFEILGAQAPGALSVEAEPTVTHPAAPTSPSALRGPLVIRVVRGGKLVREARLTAEIVKIGTEPSATLCLDDDPKVSRLQAVLEVCDGAVSVADLGSRGGTFLNGKKVDTARVRSGDVITVGNTRLEVTFG